ncbi:hybrid sensor histidine kinase/response regulator [Chenggangzhangella methanolivorans]|uniref:histidine kinase n=1 Tax=Chenggangzhangella methanolivorans TaxID=1437009 RepID=A0A9E6R763_9HYPH|nr:response regulator [Chenggangzhangella methanolivorans]QZN98646.1 response regulator [Chenggangzhangella methanolivorans]
MSYVTSRLLGRFAPETAAGDARPDLAALIAEAPAIVWAAGPNGETEFVSERWREVTGTAPLGDWVEAIHKDDFDELVRDWRGCVASGEPFENEHRIRVRDGTWRRFLARARPSRDADGAIVRWVGTLIDIEDLVRDREAAGAQLAKLVEAQTVDLEVAERRFANEVEGRASDRRARRDDDALYAAYLDNTTDGVFVVSCTPGRPILVETVNRTMERALGISRLVMRSRKISDILPRETSERLEGAIEACAMSGESARYEQVTELDGEERVFEIALSPVSSSDGRTVRVVGSARDLTERRKSEQQLRQAQKMEAVGQLTGGVAHDFNNLLQVVKGNLELLASELAAVMTPSIERRLRDATAGADRGAKLTRQLLAFSRRQPLAPRPTDVGALVTSMADMLDRTLGETVEVEISRDAGGWTALVDPAQLENAVLNLAINGRDAMPDGGRLAIAVRHLPAGLSGSERIEIAVTDAGVGMSESVLARVFEPFYSTKPEGRGTGLGLPQVQGFIEQSHGEIEIQSAPGRGTTVRLSLPRSAAEAVVDPDTDGEADEPPRGAGERILLLEDDEAVRSSVADLLTALGYQVEPTATTRDATLLLEAGRAYDLLLSDVVMPGQPSPPDFARLARAKLPTLKVLFMSGYAENVIVHQGRVDADVHLIQKPYRSDQLARKLRQLLGEPAATEAAPSRPLEILLVEDEPLIAMSLVELLQSFGHKVTEARNGAKAKAAISDGAKFDLLLTDLGLPDIDGQALAEWARVARPSLPILFSTGRDDFEPPPTLLEGGPTAVIVKPFDAESLRAAISACA